MRITAIEPQRRDDERVNVFVDGEFRLGLAADVLRRAQLRVGDSVTESVLVEAERKDALWRARQAAYRLLSHRSRSRRELRNRLLGRDFEEAVVDSCLEELRESGWIDDRAFAESFVRDRIRLNPRGTRRLVNELAEKGIARDIAERTVPATLEAEGRSELDLAREAARQWGRRNMARRAGALDSEPRFRMKRRLYGYLARRGFDHDSIRTAMSEILHEAAGDA